MHSKRPQLGDRRYERMLSQHTRSKLFCTCTTAGVPLVQRTHLSAAAADLVNVAANPHTSSHPESS